MRPLTDCGKTAFSSDLLRSPGFQAISGSTTEVPGVGEDLAALRPDIVVTHEPSRIVLVLFETVTFENTFQALEKARLSKILKNQPLAVSLRGRGCTVHVDGFVVGALGSWHPWNDRLLALLRVSSGYAGLMGQLMVSETLAWSRCRTITRKQSFISCSKRLPAARGGSLEHSFVLQRVIEDARNRKRKVVIAWLDLADHFGSVPHAVMRNTIAAVSVPARVVATGMNLYESSTVRVGTREVIPT